MRVVSSSSVPSRLVVAVITLASVALAASCSDDDVRAADASPVQRLADFSDGPWLLRVDRALRPGLAISTSAQSLRDSDYEPSQQMPSYEVRVSMQAQQVSVGETPWSGHRSASGAERIDFELTSGTFAGGRLRVWEATHGLQAELTLYGSGVPIVQSERGELGRVTR
jgi:hypothetical protein